MAWNKKILTKPIILEATLSATTIKNRSKSQQKYKELLYKELKIKIKCGIINKGSK